MNNNSTKIRHKIPNEIIKQIQDRCNTEGICKLTPLRKGDKVKIINKYLNEISPFKKGYIREKQRLNRILTENIVLQKIYQLNTNDFTEYKNKRLKFFK